MNSETDVKPKPNFRDLLDERRGLLDADRYEAVVERIARTLIAAFSAGRKVLWMGNGGSAADAQHLAAELTGLTDDDPQAALWIVHVVLSLAYLPIGNKQTEHEVLRRFVAPAFD